MLKARGHVSLRAPIGAHSIMAVGVQTEHLCFIKNQLFWSIHLLLLYPRNGNLMCIVQPSGHELCSAVFYSEGGFVCLSKKNWNGPVVFHFHVWLRVRCHLFSFAIAHLTVIKMSYELSHGRLQGGVPFLCSCPSAMFDIQILIYCCLKMTLAKSYCSVE